MDSETEKYAPWVAAGGFAPMLLDETAASLIGTKDLMKHIGFWEGFKKGLRLLPAWGTYASMPLGAYGAVKLYQKLKEDKNADK